MTGEPTQPQDVTEQHGVPFGAAVRTWFLISLQTFGGPAGQIAVMQRALVDEKRWIGQRRFLHALNYCTLLPGPEAQQLATYIGWLMHGTAGGLIAGGLFVLPGVVALLALSAVYVAFGTTTVVTSVFAGLAAAVLAIVVQAVIRVARRALDSRALVLLAVASFVALAVFGVPFPVVVALAGVAGWALGRWRPSALPREKAAAGPDAGPPPVLSDDVLHHEVPTTRRTLRVLAGGLGAGGRAGGAGRPCPGRGPPRAPPPAPRRCSRTTCCTTRSPRPGGPCGCWRSAWSRGGCRSWRWPCSPEGTACSPSRGSSSPARRGAPSGGPSPGWPLSPRR